MENIMSNLKNNKNNVALLKMARDINSELNHRIRFTSNTEITYKGKPCTMCFDFMTCTPYYLTKSKKTVRGVEHSALGVNISIHYQEGCYGLNPCGFPQGLKNKLEYLDGKYSHYLKYSYKNILTIINYFYNSNFDNIVLLDSNYIINFFSYNDFNSDTFFKQENINYILEMYDKAIKFQELARYVIKMLKNSEYDNSSYYYNGSLFTVLVHWNCYNDILEFDLNNFTDSIDKMKDYEIPVEKIKNGRIEKGCKSNRLY